MTGYVRLTRLVLSSCGLTHRLVATFGLTWLAVIVGSAVTIPLKYANPDSAGFMDNGLVVGLAIPITVASRLLDETLPVLLFTAYRRPWPQRVLVALTILGTTLIGILFVMIVVTSDISHELLLADGLLLLGFSLLGTAILGGDIGFFVPLAVVLVFSAPGAVPLGINILYSVDRSSLTAQIALAVWLTGLFAYAARGSSGPGWRRRMIMETDATDS